MRKTEQQNTDDKKFAHKKSLGQNFLTSDIVPNWMCAAADVQPDELVLEIGPGTGMLTKTILEKGARVIAIEADDRAVTALEETFVKEIEEGRLILKHSDARKLDLHELSLKNHEFKVVANIPYYLSGYLLRLLLENDIQPTSITFLIQKELADRIARDKKESILALSVKVFGKPKYIKTVTKGHFYPKPKVDSAILNIKNINQDNLVTKIERENFFNIVHLGLGNKRKQLLSNLSQKYKREELTKLFSNLNIDLQARGEDLPYETWLELAKILYTSNQQLSS